MIFVKPGYFTELEKQWTGVYQDTSYGIRLLLGPTGNCQLSILGCAEQFISKSRQIGDTGNPNYWRNYDTEKESLRDFEENLLALYGSITQPRAMLLMDVKAHVLPFLESYFKKDEFVVKEKYISTNGSNMVLVLVKMQRVANIFVEREKLKNEKAYKESLAAQPEIPFNQPPTPPTPPANNAVNPLIGGTVFSSAPLSAQVRRDMMERANEIRRQRIDVLLRKYPTPRLYNRFWKP